MNKQSEQLNQRQCFAIVNRLRQRLERHGITESALWSWSLGSRGLDVIGSRSQFSQHDWAYLAARLEAAQRDQVLFTALCKTIKQQGECRVYRIEAGAEHKQVYTGVFDVDVLFRCQKHANATGREVILHAYGESKKYLPETRAETAECPPIGDVRIPHRVFEIRVDKNVTQSVEVQVPDGADVIEFARSHANAKGVKVITTDCMQHYRLHEFEPTPNVSSEREALDYIKKHGGTVETEGGTPGNFRVYVSDKNGRSLYMYKHHNRVPKQVFQGEVS